MLDLRRFLRKYFINVLFLSIILSCSSKPAVIVDLIVSADKIYLLDSAFQTAEAIAISNGKIVGVGDLKSLKSKFKAKQEKAFKGIIYPGFIDAHSHFYGYGKSLLNVDLVNTSSLDEVIERTVAFAAQSTEYWVYGRGWDQTDWIEQGFPNNTKLNLLFPDRPVVLRRIDGHAALVNQKALDLAGITTDTKIEGGEIEIRSGRLTGILIDNAADKVINLIGEPGRQAQIEALKLAEKNCFEAGLTTVTDAGLDLSQILLIDSLQKSGDLKIRVYAMANPSKENFNYWLTKGIYSTANLQMNSFKLYADGALGSRGAKLKKNYCDKHMHSGFFLTPVARLDSICDLLYENGFQVNTHCIGDSANKKMLEIYGNYLESGNSRRWRIEHAQVVSPEDRALFKKYNVIPSVQPTHATSDMPWVEDRLCKDRMEGAYAYRSLLNIHGFIPLGTDFPIENISPLETFYAAVYRTNSKQQPFGGFLPEEAISTEQALRGITNWAAYANFMEDRIGSLEVGKYADFVVLNKDILQEKYVLSTKVLYTVLEGKIVAEGSW